MIGRTLLYEIDTANLPAVLHISSSILRTAPVNHPVLPLASVGHRSLPTVYQSSEVGLELGGFISFSIEELARVSAATTVRASVEYRGEYGCRRGSL